MNPEFYRSRKLVIAGGDFLSPSGAWRSIYHYARQKDLKGESVHLVDLRGPGGWRQWLAAVLFAPRLLVNGLAALDHWRVLLALLWRRDAAVYLHDTEYSLDAFARQAPGKHALLARILGRNPICCVSEAAASLYRARYGASRTLVIRECVPLDEAPEFEPGCQHIMMVGSIEERKGVDLFSRTADLAAAEGLAWRFHWVGSRASTQPLYQSPQVTWHGWHLSAGEFLRKSDVFFLSSLDDPCPLAALEALALDKRCIAYRATGISEIIMGISGCVVHDEPTAEACLAALKQCLAAPLDSVRLRQKLAATVSLESFSQNLDRLFS